LITAARSRSAAAFILGAAASINFGQEDGRITFKFRNQTGLLAGCTDANSRAILIANKYNLYGSYGTANQGFIYMAPGSVTGPFTWADSYVNQIYMNSQFQLALIELMTNSLSLPYNQEGYSKVKAACADVINAMLTFGAIRVGVILSAAEAAEVNSAAGLAIDQTLTNQGWYLQVLDPGAQARGQRTTPACNFFYMDGGSIQMIALASIDVQ
jgi:hypothetical protein